MRTQSDREIDLLMATLATIETLTGMSEPRVEGCSSPPARADVL